MQSKNKIYIIHHPETEWNKKHILQGHKDSSLTRKGELIAKKLGKILKKKGILRIYSSDLGRCVQTSKIISKILNVKIVKSKKLRERNFGDLNGFPDKKINILLDKNNLTKKAPNGESFNDMKKRIFSFIKNLQKNKNILIVTHDGCVRALLSELCDVNPNSKESNLRVDEIIELEN